jgi:N-acetyl-gamma-glutamyl-phosphate reductase
MIQMIQRIPSVVLGGSGYVAGELVRLLAAHPDLEPTLVISESKPGALVGEAFPHLRAAVGDLRFAAAADLPAALDSLHAGSDRLALFSAAPHGASAALVDGVLAEAERRGFDVHAVDLSADFRFTTAAAYEAVYRHPHGARDRLTQFSSAIPEHVEGCPSRHVGHPGCFTTAVSLATVPLVALDLLEEPARLTAVAVTGSTGSGRTPGAKTHHPERRSNLQAYSPFAHRHAPEMEGLIEARSGRRATVDFLPHSGPFARGIHATVTGRLREASSAEEVAARLREFYRGSAFVSISTEPPALQAVVGTNRAELAIAVADRTVAVFSAIDNLVKGAAGGGVQWMNRLFGLPEGQGLRLAGLGWL